MEIVITIATCFSAGATVAIAAYAYFNHKLTLEVQKRDKEYRQQVSDLYQAMAISYLLYGTETTSATRTIDYKIKEFKNLYKGKTNIFD